MTRVALPAVLLFALCLVAAPAAGEYRVLEIEALRIVVDSDWGVRLAPGYFPVRFDITNLGDARVIEIVSQGNRSTRTLRTFQSGSLGIRQAVRLAPGDRVRLTIPVPVYGDTESFRFEIREGGRVLERIGYGGVRSRAAPIDAAVLVVADVSSDLAKAAASSPRPASGVVSGMVTSRGGGAPVRAIGPLLDFILDAERVPTNWVGYTSLRAVVVDAPEWEQLNDPQKSALLTWAACGGDLVLIGGHITRLLPPDGIPPTEDGQSYPHLFGRIFVMPAEMASASIATLLTATDTGRDRTWSLPANHAPDWGAIASRGFRLPIPGIEGVPARMYLTILVLFAILIGPVNYWFLARRRRQVLVVLTAPIISAVFIVLLAAYAVAGEGLGVYGRAVTFTVLDQVKRQSATRAAFSLYAAGMAPSSGLQFSRDVAVFPIGVDGNGATGRVEMDLTDAQRFSSGLASARSATNLETVSFRQTRERLTFTRVPEGLTVVNGFDTTLLALSYRDGEQQYALRAPLPPGGKSVLTINGTTPKSLLPLSMPPASKLAPLIDRQPGGSYLAVLERSPFWEAGVPRLTERGSFHLVLGWPEGPS